MRFKSIRPPVFAYDFYLSFVPDDEDSVQRVRDLLCQHKSDVKFFIPNQQTQDTATEERIFSSMKICSRFVQRWLIFHFEINADQIHTCYSVRDSRAFMFHDMSHLTYQCQIHHCFNPERILCKTYGNGIC